MDCTCYLLRAILLGRGRPMKLGSGRPWLGSARVARGYCSFTAPSCHSTSTCTTFSWLGNSRESLVHRRETVEPRSSRCSLVLRRLSGLSFPLFNQRRVSSNNSATRVMQGARKSTRTYATMCMRVIFNYFLFVC